MYYEERLDKHADIHACTMGEYVAECNSVNHFIREVLGVVASTEGLQQPIPGVAYRNGGDDIRLAFARIRG